MQEFHLSKVGDNRLLKLLDIWNAARTGVNEMPRKSAIDIATMGEAKLLPYTWLVEIPDEGEPFYRVAGDQIRTLFGTTMQQRALGEIYDTHIANMLEERWRRMLRERTFTHTAGLVYFDTYQSLEGERLALPVSDETDTPRFILGATFYEYTLLKPAGIGPREFEQRVNSSAPIVSIAYP